MRYVRFCYRRTRFTSLASINQALGACVERINARRHSRFGVSRRERFDTIERAALKPLPIGHLEYADWKDATLHPDCYVYIEGDYYSAPHIHRHKKLRVKITENHVEIFLNLERLAIHPRSRHRNGKRIFVDAHFPAASQAYYEATPQKLLSQSRFIHPDLNQLFVELFAADLFGHLRRCQGFVRSCTKEINQSGHELASQRIAAAIATMRRYNKFRVPYFQTLLVQARKQPPKPDGDRQIVRRPGNPMLRYAGIADQPAACSTAVMSVPLQEKLKL
jgi:Mu transposase-like protein